MDNTVVAVFDEYDEAQSAQAELLSSGFLREEVQLTRDGMGTTATRAGGDGEPTASGKVKDFFSSLFGRQETDAELYGEAVSHGSFVVTVAAENDQEIDQATEVLSHHHPIDIDEKSSMWRGQGISGITAGIAGAASTTEERAIPVIEEELKIGKRVVSRGGVRIYQRVTEQPVSEELKLREEKVAVERRPVDQPASAADVGAFKEGAFKVRESSEEPVVSKSAQVVEEVRIGKDIEERTEPVSDTVKRSDVEVEQLGAEQFAEDYRGHWRQNYSSLGGTYEEYEPAYRYGSMLNSDSRYQGRSWDEIEPDLRRDWEMKNPNSTWERFKDSVRYSWNKVTRKV